MIGPKPNRKWWPGRKGGGYAPDRWTMTEGGGFGHDPVSGKAGPREEDSERLCSDEINLGFDRLVSNAFFVMSAMH